MSRNFSGHLTISLPLLLPLLPLRLSLPPEAGGLECGVHSLPTLPWRPLHSSQCLCECLKEPTASHNSPPAEEVKKISSPVLRSL